ncbi:thermonuclease family protein [Pseudomonas sp. MBLB4123]|uniref:thermonuclease family protein n=1 Tax=Pseudomonas sp. MBLB4123 TaxID=3451557 RepID=UPI003F751A5E
MACSALLRKASLVGAFFVSALYLAPALALCPPSGPLQSVQVQRVVDGDTLRLADGRRVRLIGLNSPELGRDGRSAEPYAEAARRRLDELVSASGRRIGLQLGRQARDRYGRTLAHGFDARGRNLEAQLLAEGLGYLVAIAPNLALLDCQRAAEQQARQAHAGLWRRPPLRSPQQLSRGGFALVRGRVERVEHNGGGVWLELDGPLVLQVAPKALAHFDVQRLQRLAGKRVEARGWVVDRSRRGGVKPGKARWLLPLSHEAMLEVLR